MSELGVPAPMTMSAGVQCQKFWGLMLCYELEKKSD
jgi:hypothetical protein